MRGSEAPGEARLKLILFDDPPEHLERAAARIIEVTLGFDDGGNASLLCPSLGDPWSWQDCLRRTRGRGATSHKIKKIPEALF